MTGKLDPGADQLWINKDWYGRDPTQGSVHDVETSGVLFEGLTICRMVYPPEPIWRSVQSSIRPKIAKLLEHQTNRKSLMSCSRTVAVLFPAELAV